ncbi:MAG TPA: hypothetical protein VHM19_12225, partial [Polyangiales bacterium]|nr:hypothetical protein [Polyangiales bacterium]
MEIAVLDLGSTTFHLQHVRVESGDGFVTTLDTKRTPLLGAQVFQDGYIDRRSWLESLEAVWELLKASRACRPDHLVVVATSAIRSASNGLLLVREMERRHEVSVRILDPNEEARLAYLGHTTSPMIRGRRVAVIDLGGGSVEVAIGEGTHCLDSISLPLGAVRLRSKAANAAFTREDARALTKIVRPQLEPVAAMIARLSPDLTVFGSGSARAARRLLLRDGTEPGKTGPVELAALLSGLQRDLGASPERLVELGVEPPRAHSVLAAATIMTEILDVLGVAYA